MTKIMVIPANLDLEKDQNNIDAYIFGIKDLSVNMPFYITIDELKQIITKLPKEKEVFVSLNKNFINSDLPKLKEAMDELEKMTVTGILYYDVAVVNIKSENELKTPLVWGAEHLTTNYATMNYWKEFGAEYAYVSAEITHKEILDIRKNTDVKLMVPAFGYIPMFVSKRHEVQNYLKYFKLQDHSNIHYLKKEGKTYPIIDDELGTTVYSADILNGYKEFLEWKEVGIDYVVLNAFLIEPEKFSKILSIFKEDNPSLGNTIDSMFSNTDKGFLYKETVYQVKKYE